MVRLLEFQVSQNRGNTYSNCCEAARRLLLALRHSRDSELSRNVSRPLTSDIREKRFRRVEGSMRENTSLKRKNVCWKLMYFNRVWPPISVGPLIKRKWSDKGINGSRPLMSKMIINILDLVSDLRPTWWL